MKILSSTIAGNTALSTKVLTCLERLVCTHHTSVPDGWRAIIEMQATGDDTPFFALDVQGNKGGGNYAEVKMNTLKLFPELSATGLDSIGTFADRVGFIAGRVPEDRMDEFDLMRGRLMRLDYIEQMPRETAELLREYGLTSYKGAIRVPYESQVSTDTGVQTRSGEIRIAFSGAEEWQDMLLSIYLLSQIQQSLAKLWESDQIWYNIRGLKANHQTQMLCHYLGVNEA